MTKKPLNLVQGTLLDMNKQELQEIAKDVEAIWASMLTDEEISTTTHTVIVDLLQDVRDILDSMEDSS